jgi:hypothetical protein
MTTLKKSWPIFAAPSKSVERIMDVNIKKKGKKPTRELHS